MKKFLLVVVIAAALVIASLGIFLATFDADRYRPQLVAQLESALGRPVDLDRVSLGWKRGIAVELHGLTVHADRARRQPPMLAVGSVQALVQLLPLLQRDVQVASVVLQRPSVRVTRDAQGRIDVTGLAAAVGPASGPTTTDVGDATVTFNIASLQIEDGEFVWVDAAQQPPMQLQLTQVNTTVRNIAPGQPMTLDAIGALGAAQPNLRLRARVTLPDPGAPGRAEDMTFTLEQLPLQDFVPAAPGAPRLHGKLSATLSGTVPTFDPTQVTSAVSGTGRLKLEEGRVENLNVLRTVFQKLSMLPGLVERLQARLPASYQEKLTARDTLLAPVDLAWRLQHGRLSFEDFAVQTDTVALVGRGVVGLDGQVSVQTLLRIEPELTAAIVGTVRELQALANPSGELEMPVLVAGHVNRLSVQPDLQYVASRVITTKAVDVLGEVLRKQLGSPAAQDGAQTPAGEGTQAPAQPADGAGLLGQFLQRALDGNTAPGSPE